MNKDITLGYLLKILKNSLWKILAVTVVMAIIVACFTIFLMPKKYNSSIVFYIVNTSTETDYTTGTLLSATDYLANDYIAIIQSDYMLTAISDKLKSDHSIEYTASEIRGMITSETKTTTSIFSITVECENAEHAYLIAYYISVGADNVIKEFAKPDDIILSYRDEETGELIKIPIEPQDPVKVLRDPELNEEPVSPSLVVNVLITVFVVAVVMYLIFFLKDLLDSTIRTEENVKEKIKHPLIGTIPEWKIHSTKKD